MWVVTHSAHGMRPCSSIPIFSALSRTSISIPGSRKNLWLAWSFFLPTYASKREIVQDKQDSLLWYIQRAIRSCLWLGFLLSPRLCARTLSSLKRMLSEILFYLLQLYHVITRGKSVLVQFHIFHTFLNLGLKVHRNMFSCFQIHLQKSIHHTSMDFHYRVVLYFFKELVGQSCQL